MARAALETAQKGLVQEHRRLAFQADELYMGELDAVPILKVTLPSRWKRGRFVTRRAGGHGCGHLLTVNTL